MPHGLNMNAMQKKYLVSFAAGRAHGENRDRKKQKKRLKELLYTTLMAHWYGGSKISKTSNSNFGGSGLAGPPVTCETQVSLSGSLFPSHEACRYQDEGANWGCNSFIGGPYTPSTSRCFSELGFTCRNEGVLGEVGLQLLKRNAQKDAKTIEQMPHILTKNAKQKNNGIFKKISFSLACPCR